MHQHSTLFCNCPFPHHRRETKCQDCGEDFPTREGLRLHTCDDGRRSKLDLEGIADDRTARKVRPEAGALREPPDAGDRTRRKARRRSGGSTARWGWGERRIGWIAVKEELQGRNLHVPFVLKAATAATPTRVRPSTSPTSTSRGRTGRTEVLSVLQVAVDKVVVDEFVSPDAGNRDCT